MRLIAVETTEEDTPKALEVLQYIIMSTWRPTEFVEEDESE